jgi:Ni,Fe-hydrogenase III small subunit
MQRILRKIIKVGTVTEPLGRSEQTIEVLGSELDRVIRKRFQKSLAIRQVDAGSCNACELEIHAMNNPYYDLERFGVHFVASPRHADLLLVTGPVSRNMEVALKMTYDAVPNPKMVIAAGDCAVCGGEFGCTYATVGAVSQVIPVDVLIHGCPPAPTDLIRGILMAVGLPE